ncbi:ethylbenzene dehydrogenase-related protein [Bradyrhizobium sp.]|uniref:ethylbenzene dehydrogenase-related protein n=1 Tax=Bradyrhizobium sp. TaxID=376 RepID=UPI002633A73E|nr:ethylbenzene dehydrogenase-related protein [Bradyrhizobium sp.]
MRQRKTDYGTVLLHWLVVAAIGVAFLSGLRIATEAPGRTWINLFDALLPRTNVWTMHIEAAVVLIAIAIAYTVYLVRSGLSSRVRLDKLRLRALIGRKHGRLGAFSVLLTWVFFLTMATLIVSGGLLYFGLFADHGVAAAHWWASWAVPLFTCLHVVVQVMIGGTSQLFRIVRPGRLPPPPPRLDAAELLALLVEQSGQPAAPSRQRPQAGAQTGSAAKQRDVTLHSNPFIVAAAFAILGTGVLIGTDVLVVDSLYIHRISSGEAPILDGDTSDPVWRNIQPFSLMTNQGDNFDGKGETRINIRAVHDGTWAYFLFTWEDPTRSLKQLPLIKRADGWQLLHDGYERGEERDFNEDKFAILFTTLEATLAGDHTFHAGPQPVADAPATKTGRGLHYTPAEGIYADVWQWKATSGGPSGWMDDDHFGPPLKPTPMQLNNVVPYRGGFAPDPGTANYFNNFDAPLNPTDRNQLIRPRRLPKDAAATTAAMGSINLDPEVGESDGARWFMTETESVPYTTELDRQIPVGTVIPGVIISGEFSGDRADVRCAARWASGHWSLEVARRLDTHSQFDVPIKTGVFMRVAAFDHSQIGHTRHVRPIRIEVE